jgi:hypothetical protein
MSQAQPQSATPPPLPDTVCPTEIETQVDHTTEFYDHLHAPEPEAPPPLPDTPSRQLTTPVAYRPTGSNVFPLDSIRPGHHANSRQVLHEQVLHEQDISPLLRLEPRRARPRNARRPKQAIVKKRYRISRFIAALFAFTGWAIAAAGFTALVMSLLQSDVSLRWASPDVLGSAGVLFVGLLTVVLAVAARASFDTANNQQEMLAMQQRARFGAGSY